MTDKLYVDLHTFRKDSYELAAKILNDEFKPDFIIALWRGGSFPGMCMHELFKWSGINTDHIAVRTSKYTGIDQVLTENGKLIVNVHSLGYITDRLKTNSKVLIVDDIFDTGHTIESVFTTLKNRLCDNMPTDIRVATIYYKPSRNKTNRVPEYTQHVTTEWVVFPHEVEAMSIDEIETSKGPEIANIFRSIKK